MLSFFVELVELESEVGEALFADDVVGTGAVECVCESVDEGGEALEELAVHM
jgi:hypothetical protein